MFRELRHWLTAGVTNAALRAAPQMQPQTVDEVGGLLARWGPALPVVGPNVAANLRAAGLYTPEICRAHFAELGAHFAGALHALRCGGPDVGPELVQLATQRIGVGPELLDPRCVERLRGAILVGPHICNYLLNLTRLNLILPLTVYLRYSREPRRRTAKERWYRASGVQWIAEPAGNGHVLGRLAPMAAALAQGRTLFITPDLPQKRGAGVPVRFFGREIELPAGAALLALRTGAPLYLLTARRTGSDPPLAGGISQTLRLSAPYAGGDASAGRHARRAAIQDRLQWFADGFAQFLTEQAPLWYLWGDKRWTRLFRGDPRYVSVPGAGIQLDHVPSSRRNRDEAHAYSAAPAVSGAV